MSYTYPLLAVIIRSLTHLPSLGKGQSIAIASGLSLVNLKGSTTTCTMHIPL